MKILQFRFLSAIQTPPSTFSFNFGKCLCNNGIENYWEKFLLKEVIMIDGFFTSTQNASVYLNLWRIENGVN
jgi:hypothetical protein